MRKCIGYAILGALLCVGSGTVGAGCGAVVTTQHGTHALTGVDGPYNGTLLDARAPTLLVFATTWCASCEDERPELYRWAREHADVAVRYIVSGSPASEVSRALRGSGLGEQRFPLLVDAGGAIADEYRIEYTPTLVLVAPDGEILGRWSRVSSIVVPDADGAHEDVDAGDAATADGAGTAQSDLRVFSDTGTELGTSYFALIVAEQSREADARRAFATARDTVHELDAVLSNWREDSEVALLNRSSGEVFAASATLRALLSGALQVAEATGGAFDPTWAAFDAVWTAAAEADAIPSAEDIAAAAAAVGYDGVVIDESGIQLLRPGAHLGIAGVAKGWIIDAVFFALRNEGFDDVFVNIGGDIRSAGRDVTGERHILNVVDPDDTQRVAVGVEIENIAVATSGNYLRYRVIDGESFGHILDPRTGSPPAFTGSVTVFTEDAAMADALATALFVMGPDEGLAFAMSLDRVEALYVSDGQVRATFDTDAPAGNVTMVR